jgi:peptidoglycan/xylan/chitin deacetylase (PgdA/CDA1 family)
MRSVAAIARPRLALLAATAFTAGLGASSAWAEMPSGSPEKEPGPASEPIGRVETTERLVAVTFDACATRQGSYGFDREVFDIINRERLPITVFVSGRWVDTHPDEMLDMAEDPLVEFGDHSYDHPHMNRIPADRIASEIDRTEATLARYGKHSVAFRPPFGDWDRRVVEIAKERHLPTVTWDVVSGDPSTKTTTETMIHGVVNHARPGSIIIFHINGRGWKTHEALPTILAGLRERGFRFVPLSDLVVDKKAVAPPSLETPSP